MADREHDRRATMMWCRAHRVASLMLILTTLAFSPSAWAQFQTDKTAGASGGGCTTGNYAWPDTNGFALKCVSGAWVIETAAPAGSNTQVQYNNSGALGGDSSFTYVTPGAVTLGVNASHAGTLGLANGGGSGATVTIQNNGATSAYNFNLPTAAVSSGNILTSGGGSGTAMTWDTTTGSGTVVALATTPTFVTNITDPLVIGGTGAASTLTLESTSGSGTSDSIIFKTGSQATAMTINTSQQVGIGATPTNILSLTGQAAETFWMERETTASTAGNNLTISAGGAKSGGTDLAGGNLVLSSGISTGTRASNVQFQTYPAAASTGTADNAATVAITISETGTVTGGAGSFGNLATALQTTAASGTDKNGSTLTLASGVSTGTGSSGINFKVYGAGSTGSAANAATTAMTIASTGYVGIGITVPGENLDVANYMRVQGSPGALTGYAASGTGVEITYDTTNDIGYLISYTRTVGYKKLYLDGSTLALNPDSGGNVGIGTTSPGAKLDVNGAFRVLSQTTPPSGVGLEAFYNGSGGFLFAYDRTNSVAEDLTLGGAANAVTIKSGGNVGIDTAAPVVKLQVSQDGTTPASALYSSSNDGIITSNVGYAQNRLISAGTG